MRAASCQEAELSSKIAASSQNRLPIFKPLHFNMESKPE
jgi:hypothetical protein